MNTRRGRSASVCTCVRGGWRVSALMYPGYFPSHRPNVCASTHTHVHTRHEPAEPQAGLSLGSGLGGAATRPLHHLSHLPLTPLCTLGHTSLGSPWAPPRPSFTSRRSPPILSDNKPQSWCCLLPTAGCGCVPEPAHPLRVGPLPAQQTGTWDLGTEAAGRPS